MKRSVAPASPRPEHTIGVQLDVTCGTVQKQTCTTEATQLVGCHGSKLLYHCARLREKTVENFRCKSNILIRFAASLSPTAHL
jgi:hypothetical protein